MGLFGKPAGKGGRPARRQPKQKAATGGPPPLHIDQREDLEALRHMFPNGRPPAVMDYGSRPPTNAKKNVLKQQVDKRIEASRAKAAQKRANPQSGLFADQVRDQEQTRHWRNIEEGIEEYDDDDYDPRSQLPFDPREGAAYGQAYPPEQPQYRPVQMGGAGAPLLASNDPSPVPHIQAGQPGQLYMEASAPVVAPTGPQLYQPAYAQPAYTQGFAQPEPTFTVPAMQSYGAPAFAPTLAAAPAYPQIGGFGQYV